MSSPTERDRAVSLARANHRAALEAARKVSHAFLRSQALAWVARFAPDSSVKGLIDEAVAAAQESDDPYERIAALAWSLRAALERGHSREARPILARALNGSGAIGNPTRRVDALFLVAQAAWPESALRGDATAAVVNAARSPGKKASSVLRDLALLVAATGGDASGVVATITDPKCRRQAERHIAERLPFTARPFFW